MAAGKYPPGFERKELLTLALANDERLRGSGLKAARWGGGGFCTGIKNAKMLTQSDKENKKQRGDKHTSESMEGALLYLLRTIKKEEAFVTPWKQTPHCGAGTKGPGGRRETGAELH